MARPWSERYDHSAWIDSVLEAQRRGQGPPQHVDDADDDDDEYGDFPFMPDDDKYHRCTAKTYRSPAATRARRGVKHEERQILRGVWCPLSIAYSVS